MLMLAAGGSLTVRFGKAIEPADALRLSETLSAFAPVSIVTMDFSEVGALDAQGLVSLARTLRGLDRARLLVRGLPWHHLRVLQMLGVPATGAGVTSHERAGSR